MTSEYSKITKRLCEEQGISYHTYVRVLTLDSVKGLPEPEREKAYLQKIDKIAPIFRMEVHYGDLDKEYADNIEKAREIRALAKSELEKEKAKSLSPVSPASVTASITPGEIVRNKFEQSSQMISKPTPLAIVPAAKPKDDEDGHDKIKIGIMLGMENYEYIKELSTRSGTPIANLAVMLIDMGIVQYKTMASPSLSRQR